MTGPPSMPSHRRHGEAGIEVGLAAIAGFHWERHAQTCSCCIGPRVGTGLSAALLAVAIALPLAAAAAPTDEQAVAAVDDEYVAAEVRRDEPTMRRLVDDRFVLDNADGTTTGKTRSFDRC